MKIKNGSYNVAHVVIDNDNITPGTPAIVGTERDLKRLERIVESSGLIYIDSAVVAGETIRGVMTASHFYGGAADGLDLGLMSNHGGTPTAITGTAYASGGKMYLYLTVTVLE